MVSEVDYTFPADGEKASKSEFRDILRTIYDEITALQARTNVAGAQAYYNFITPEEARVLIKQLSRPDSLARDIAFDRVSL